MDPLAPIRAFDRGFFSIFPLLLLFVRILAFVLHGDSSAQHSIEQSVLKQAPQAADLAACC